MKKPSEQQLHNVAWHRHHYSIAHGVTGLQLNAIVVYIMPQQLGNCN